MRSPTPHVSKLPMRQLTSNIGPSGKLPISKLSMRQLTS